MEIRLDWLGCATFRLTLGETVVFLDAYMDRVPTAPKIGLSAKDVRRADFVLVGHAHFDHIRGRAHCEEHGRTDHRFPRKLPCHAGGKTWRPISSSPHKEASATASQRGCDRQGVPFPAFLYVDYGFAFRHGSLDR